MGPLDLAVGGGLDHVEREGRASVLRVALVVEVDVVAVLRDVLEVRVGLRDSPVDRRLVLGVEPVRLGEAAVLRDVDAAVRHPGRRSRLHGSEPFCLVNVVVVLPVPESPTAKPILSPSFVGMTLQPACSGRPPRS